MGIRVKRKTFKAGGDSRAVVLPASWVTYYAGKVDQVTIIGSDLLVIAPAGLEQRAEDVAAYIDGHTAVVAGKSKTGGSS